MAEYKVRKAKTDDIEYIYQYSREEQVRTLGIKDSIENGNLYVFFIGKEFRGFIRFSPQANKTTDYAKINEFVVYEKEEDDNNIESIITKIFKTVDLLIFGYGFDKARVVVSVGKENLYIRNGWHSSGIKSTSSKKGMTYYNIVLERYVNPESVKKVEFGGFINK